MLLLLGFLTLGNFSCQKDDDLSVSSKEELEEKLQVQFEDNELTSISYCVVKNDSILHSSAMGFADIDNNQLATDQTRYLVASVSKTITAVAIMQLAEQNLIALDDDINQYLPFPVRNPAFPDDKITLRMLLSHRSSISDVFQETLTLDCYGTDCPMSLEQYFNAVFTNTGQYFSPDNFSTGKPGAVEDYSNLGSALVGYLVERITQTPFDIYCKNNIFIPLGMTKTEWRLANTPLSELAIPYSDEITNPNPHYTFPDYPNGGLRTNVLDLSKFLRMVIQNGSFNNTQILSQATMAEMKTLQLGSTEFCLSFYYDTFNGRTVLGHNGGEKGVTAEMFYDTTNNVGVIVFSNEEDAELENIVTLLFNYGDKQ
ncbi:MAG: D-aminopeptidase [Bacteroidia bacterium]|nr:D-aminopeptidase [Bacteroidia bacterium]